MLHNLCEKFVKLAEGTNCSAPGCEKKNCYTKVDGKNYCYEHSYSCKLCKKVYNSVENPHKIYKGQYACPNCTANFESCSECSDALQSDLLLEVEGKQYCVDCIPQDTTIACPNCSEVVGTDELGEMKNYSKSSIGCKQCARQCTSCDKWKDNDYINFGPDGDPYCEDCFGEAFGFCDECSDTIDRDDLVCPERGDKSLCQSCYNSSYGRCHECEKETPQNNLYEHDGENYCEDCLPATEDDEDDSNVGSSLPEAYQGLSLPEGYQYTDRGRYLNILKRYLPISIKELNKKYPRLVSGLKDLIAFSGGKDLTEEVVSAYEEKLEKENFPAKYTTWRSSLQRSVKSNTPQFVLNILASEALLAKLEQITAIDFFEKVNLMSKENGHPYVENQIGWARLELDSNKEYILVDEIQNDHMNALDRIKTGHSDGVIYLDHIKRRTGMTDEEITHMLSEYKKLIKNFPDIAIAAITKFAKENGFKKIYWHEYESGRNLKHNDPPESLYTEVPKRHFFEPTEEQPFGLKGKFFGREARMKMFKKVLGSK